MVLVVLGVIATALYYGSRCYIEDKYTVGFTLCGVFIVVGIVAYVGVAYGKAMGWILALLCGASMGGAVYYKIKSLTS